MYMINFVYVAGHGAAAAEGSDAEESQNEQRVPDRRISARARARQQVRERGKIQCNLL